MTDVHYPLSYCPSCDVFGEDGVCWNCDRPWRGKQLVKWTKNTVMDGTPPVEDAWPLYDVSEEERTPA